MLQGGRIASLDGLRGVAVLLVLVGHLIGESIRPTGLADTITAPLQSGGDLGVEMFFVLSGYLITSILTREHTKTGRISLRKFYVRRALRIWPAFYTFIAVVAVLTIVGVLALHAWDLIAAGLFIWDYAPGVSGWWLSHTWSLSIEEQFYLLWPAVLILIRPKRAVWFAAIGFLIVPVLRVATYLVSNEVVRERIWHMLHARADSLLIGCLIALLVALRPEFIERVARVVIRYRLAIVAVPVLVLSQWLTRWIGGQWQLTVGFTIENLAIAAIFLTALTPTTLLARALAWKPLRLVGLISFSLYLWQQLFLTDENTTVLGNPLIGVVASFAAATLSYVLIERPFLRLKPRFETARAEPLETETSNPSRS